MWKYGKSQLTITKLTVHTFALFPVIPSNTLSVEWSISSSRMLISSRCVCFRNAVKTFREYSSPRDWQPESTISNFLNQFSIRYLFTTLIIHRLCLKLMRALKYLKLVMWVKSLSLKQNIYSTPQIIMHPFVRLLVLLSIICLSKFITLFICLIMLENSLFYDHKVGEWII